MRIVYGILVLTSTGLFTIYSNVSLQMLSFVLILGQMILFCVDLIRCIFSQGAKPRGQGLLWLGWNILVLILMVPVIRGGVIVRNEIFLEKIPLYQQAVDEMAASIQTFDVLQVMPMPDRFRSLALVALVEKSSDHVITVEFITGGGFPVKHRGYLYRSNDNIDDDLQEKARWPYLKRIRSCWFAFSD